MNILIDITHPAHLHFFKNPIKILEERGHKVFLGARRKDVTVDLLDNLGMSYELFSIAKKGLVSLAKELITHEKKLFFYARKNKIDLMMNIGGTFIVHPGLLLGIPTIVFSDTEHAKISNLITYPFATKICTPTCYFDDLGRKQVKYNGYHELSYLHPNRFKPDLSVLSKINLNQNDKFFIIRFISWEASHDSGQWGFTLKQKRKLIHQLERFGKVFISSEGVLPDEFKPYLLPTNPIEIHHLLAFSSLYIGEGATMATESAILGTPSIYVNSLTAGTIEELINKYGLMSRFIDGDKAIEKAIEIVNSPNSKDIQNEKKNKFLAEKIDVTSWLVEFIENFFSK